MSEGYADSGHIVSVEFDPKVKVYWWLGAMLVQASTVIGLFVVPFWLILGPGWSHPEVMLEASGGHLGTSGASGRASWLQVPPRTLPGPSQDPPGEPPGGSRS